MNRRSFLTRLGTAAIGAAALAIDDPERLLWTPGQKTIIDFGATKQVLPATDAEVVGLAREVLASQKVYNRGRSRELDLMDLGPRDVTLTLGQTAFRYKGDKLVSLHSEEELRKLDAPFLPRPGVTDPEVQRRIITRDSAKWGSYRGIELPEDE